MNSQRGNSIETNEKMEKNANNIIDMEVLLTGLKKEDRRNLTMMRNFKWLLYVMVIIYFALMVVNPDPELTIYDRATGLCYVVAFVLFALVFRKFHREFGRIDYSLPSSEMLAKAAERYDLRPSKYLYVIPSLLLVDIGLTISEFNRWTEWAPMNRILAAQAVYIPLLAVSASIGYLIWRKRQKPLRDGARNLLNELREP